MALLGIEFIFESHTEKIVSALGGFIGILFVIGINQYLVGPEGATLIVASMGASAVLLFAVPHGALSQPWPLIGGHLISATIGVTCAELIPYILLAAPLAVALAIIAMYYLRCIHPPGGATALTAVIGGTEIHALGYFYILTPVFINVFIILLTAIAVNSLFPWRKYPVSLVKRKQKEQTIQSDTDLPISPADLTYALKQMDSFIDVTEEDLTRIYTLAMQHAQHHHLNPAQIKVHRFYSNGRYHKAWAIRQVLNLSESTDSTQRVVTYKVVAGKNRRAVATCSLEEFANWAESEVFLNENSWQRVESTS